MEVAFHSESRPVFQFSIEIRACRFRLQAERMPAQINALFAARSLGNVEARAKMRQRIAGVHLGCEVLSKFKAGVAQVDSSGVSSLRTNRSALSHSKSSMRST